jgi:hypothetical protein
VHHEVQEHFPDVDVRHEGLLLNGPKMCIDRRKHKAGDPHSIVQTPDGSVLDHSDAVIPLFNWEEGRQRDYISLRDVPPFPDLFELLHHLLLLHWVFAILLGPLIPRWGGLEVHFQPVPHDVPVVGWPLPIERAGSITPSP